MNFLREVILEIQSFHFIRPYYLLTILPAFLAVSLLLYREKMSNAWQRHIDHVLLAPLLQGKINRARKTVPILALLFWIICAVALAGPTWEKLPTPIEKRDTALVILMDLSPSMLARDVSPSRLIAARHKIMDLLQLRKEGYTALIGYSGDAHLVSPLTDDTQTIANLLNVLEPGIMPFYGSNVEDALRLGLQTLQNGGYVQGDILLVTDGMTDEALENTTNLLKGKSFTLSIIGVGTETGGPIPTGNGDFIKDKQGKIILPQLHANNLITLARKVNGYYSPLRLDDNDIQPLVTGTSFFNQGLHDKSHRMKSERKFDQWRDVGGTLCLLLLPLLLIGFRRGVFLGFVFLIPSMQIPDAQAADSVGASSFHIPPWSELWLNDNQRAMKAMKNNAYDVAAKQFKDPDWKASAQYQQGDYESALEFFRHDLSTKGLYNQGNALAKSGRLQEAITAYNEALKKNPQFEDAAFNKKIVEDLLKQQQKQSQDQQQDQSGNESKNQPNDQGQQNNQRDDQQQNNSGQQKNSDSNADARNEPDPGKLQQAHEDNNDKTDQTAQKQSAKNGKDQPEQNPANKPGDKNMGENQEQPDNKGKPTGAESKLTPEQSQALEQWLRQVPDDPSGLLRNKFEYYYQQRLQEQKSGKTSKHTNDEERW